MVSLTQEPIDVAQLISTVGQPSAGGVVLFLGLTREMTHGRRTTTLHYEAYRPMAVAEMQKLSDEARRRWMLDECHIVHRLGEVPLGEASVAVVASSAHRDAAFAASRWLIDTLKQRVPIWKQEHWSDGTSEWVHHGECCGHQGAAAHQGHTGGRCDNGHARQRATGPNQRVEVADD